MKTNTLLKIDNKEIDLKNWLVTIIPESEKKSIIKIEMSSYSELGYILNSLISVCQSALNSFNENQDFTEIQKEKHLGCSSLDLANVLGLAKKLIPFSELQLLDKMIE